MTGKEAYEILVKYSGGEDSLLMVSEMIHIVGVDKTVEAIKKQLSNSGKHPDGKFYEWMKQGFEYMKSLQENKN